MSKDKPWRPGDVYRGFAPKPEPKSVLWDNFLAGEVTWLDRIHALGKGVPQFTQWDWHFIGSDDHR